MPPLRKTLQIWISAAGVDVTDVNAAIVRRDVSLNTRNEQLQR